MGVTNKSSLAADPAGRKATAKGVQNVSRFDGGRAAVRWL